MAYTISNAHIKAFESQIRHLAQQTDARLRPWVQERSGAAASRSWPRIASHDWTTKGARGTNTAVSTVIADSQYSDRIASVVVKEDSDLVEQDEIAQVAIDPNAAVLQKLAYGGRRAIDSIIIAAATDNATNLAGDTITFPAGQVVGDYSTEFDFSMITQVNELFLTNNVPPDEPKCFVIGPKQARALLHEALATNVWYVEAKQLVAGGFVKNFMGFDFIVSNLLTAPATGQLQCFAMTRKALGLTVAKDIWVRVAEDPSASFAWRIYSSFTMGAVRVEDEHIVWAKFKDTCSVA